MSQTDTQEAARARMFKHTWTGAKIEELIRLWNQIPQLSTIEIGERMGISKNAAVGKAHRLGLEPRPSPIRPRADGHESNQEPVRRRLPARTVPLLPSEAAETRYAADWVTPERLAIMKADFPTLKPRVNIIAEMEELPGPSLPGSNTISGYIKNVLRLHRPDGFKAVSMVPRLPKTPLVTRDRRHNSVRPEPVAIEKVREVAATPKPYGRIISCLWPTNDGYPWKFCDEPSSPGRPYCHEHMHLAYVKVRDRCEDQTMGPHY